MGLRHGAPETSSSIRDPTYRRKLRHTTHLDGFPQKVKVIRDRHPLQGQFLEVLGWTHRHGSMHLTLVLPDGSRSLIPAAWTNLNESGRQNLPSANNRMTSDVIASTQHLIRARKIVDALLCEIESAKEGNKRAKTNGTLACVTGTVSAPGDLGDSRSSTTKRYHNRSGHPDQQNGSFRRHEPDSGGTP